MLGLYSEQLNVGADETELNTGTSPERLKPPHQALYIHSTISVRAKDLCINFVVFGLQTNNLLFPVYVVSNSGIRVHVCSFNRP